MFSKSHFRSFWSIKYYFYGYVTIIMKNTTVSLNQQNSRKFWIVFRKVQLWNGGKRCIWHISSETLTGHSRSFWWMKYWYNIMKIFFLLLISRKCWIVFWEVQLWNGGTLRWKHIETRSLTGHFRSFWWKKCWYNIMKKKKSVF